MLPNLSRLSGCTSADLASPTDDSAAMELMYATADGELADVERLIQEGVDVNERDQNGESALVWAAKHGHINVMRILIKAGANVNIKSNSGRTALIEAVLRHNYFAVRELLKANADVDIKDNEGMTALMYVCAIKEEHAGIVIALLNANANVDLQDDDLGYTALMQAVKNRHFETVKILVDRKANVNIVSRLGRTALEMASDDGLAYRRQHGSTNPHKRIMNVLLEAGA